MVAKWTPRQKIRSGVGAAAVAAVVFVGSLTGAQIKSDRQKEEAIKEFREIPAEEQIAALEGQKKHLQQQRDAVQRKLDAFHARVEQRKEELAQRELAKRDK
jgi:uncharacterized protein YlxW (UPF0749 family)